MRQHMKKIIRGSVTSDGAGVKLLRIFAHEYASLTDPFLLLDEFGSDDPKDYRKGFPWHPHRGIETVTYMLAGRVDHEDSLGHKGSIKSGDIQWMTAGRGIMHQEMPKGKGLLQGMQLWVNLPRDHKMMPPRYMDVLKKEVPVVKLNGADVKVIAGIYAGKKGPVRDLVIDVEFFDISLDKGKFDCALRKEYTTFCYVIDGSGIFNGNALHVGQLILLKGENELDVISDKKVRFMFVTGEPIKETIAWGGPIVMNTQEEVVTAFREIRDGTFIREQAKQ
jgi:quercetin 2,3-dioxygenase